MHRFYRIALAALALLALSTTASAAQASADPITITGNGQKQSAPFALAGGTYRVDWSLGNPTSRLAWITLESTTASSVPQSEFVHTTEKDPSGQTFLYKLQPGTYYLRAFVPAAWSVTFTPDPPIETVKPIAAAPAQQAADPARFAPGSTAPLTLADFAGGWWHHGFGFGINSDGSGEASWRVYRWCTDTAGRQPCDGMDGNYIVNGGQGTVRVSRVEGRTLYGTVLTTTDADTLAPGPFTLTEYDYGIGELTDARALGATAIGASEDAGRIQRFCGPRSGDAPDWFRRIYPCGA